MDSKLTKVDDGSKCPKCSFIGRSFLAVSDVFFACMDCGCVFVPKSKRVEIRREIQNKRDFAQRVVDKVRETFKEESEIEVAVNPLKCDKCDFTGKTGQGLKVHKGKHK